MPDNNVEPEVLMNSILGKISDILINGDGKVIPKSDDHYLAFMMPGIPWLEDSFNYAIEGFGGVERRNVNPEKLPDAVGPKDKKDGGETPPPPAGGGAAADALRKYQGAENFAAVCDLVPDTSGIVDANRLNNWQPETRISHAYAIALQFSQVYNVEPDDETKHKIERWRSLLQTTTTEKDLVTEKEVTVTRESDLVKKYREKMLAYYGEMLAYNTARISALAGQDEAAVHNFAINGQLMQTKLHAAENDWISNGYRDEYDRINAAIASVEGRSFALLKQRYKDDYARSVLTSPTSGANFPYTAPTPPDFARSGSGWTNFYFDSGSYRSNHSYTKQDTSGAIGWGLNFGLGGGVKKERWDGQVNTQTFRLTFDMARVPIYRPGVNLAYLTSGFWRFDQANEEYKNTLLSDGKKPPKGLMPAITTDCLFVRNLCLTFGKQNSHFKKQKDAMDVQGGISWGPLFLGGKHDSLSQSDSFDADWSDQGIKIPGLQLIGFACWMLPKSPDPNPKVKDWI